MATLTPYVYQPKPKGTNVLIGRNSGSFISQKDWDRQQEAKAKAVQAKYIQSIINDFQSAQDKANAANELRYGQGIGIYDELAASYQPGQPYSPTYQSSLDLLQRNISAYAPGGTFGQGARTQFDVGARQSRGRAFQGLVSSGLANVTGSYDLQAAKDRGLFNLQLEDQRVGLETGARTTKATSLSAYDLQRRQALERTLTGKTGFIERREDIAPDPNLLARLIEQGASAYA